MEEVKIVINGVEVIASEEDTILEAVHKSGLDQIPTLCHDKRLEHYTSCYMCVVEVEGLNKLIPSCSTIVRSGMKISTRSKDVIETRKAALELLMSNHYADCIGPCRNNCPAGVDAQAYIALISMGKYKDALRLVKEKNPLPLSIGRVCVRDCEAACRRKYVDEPVSVNALKRFIADLDNINKWTPEVKKDKGKKAAVIGSGPAGLSCAYYLRIEGYQVTIFEKYPKPGGMLRYGIPEYRLPKEILDSEINWILDLGIELKTNVELGRDFSIKSLMEGNYDAVFIGVGAHKATKLGLEGEDNTEGIYRGIEFLKDVETGKMPGLNGKVVVVGGGNTAIDAARTALRCGADEVKIVYRRSINEMPANREEIEAVIKEGIEILFLTNPKALISENSRLKAVECLRMQLIEGKSGERPKPVALAGSEFIIDCDYLISAIGQAVDISFSGLDNECSLEKWGTLKINKESFQTTIPGVFAGGDDVTGPLTAISAIAQGKKAAESIMNYFQTGKAGNQNGSFISLKHNLAELSEREFALYKKMPREKSEELPAEERIHSFNEVEKSIGEAQAHNEAARCLECGCSEYYDCSLRRYCDEYKIDISSYKGETKKYTPDLRHPFILLDPNKCINCGRCVRTCTEVLKVSALGFVYRGFKSVVKPAMEKSLLDTNCISCGNCIDSCPTGAISEKLPFKAPGTLPRENFETICSFCSLGCKVNFKKISNDLFYISNTTEEVKESQNKGYLCTKGRFGYRYLLSRNRILDPAIKTNGVMQNVKLNEALNYLQNKLKDIIKRSGNQSVAVIASPKLSNEELYLLQKFVRKGLRNNNITGFSNLINEFEAGSLNEMLGFTASTVGMESLDKADVIVAVNPGLSEENLIMEMKIKSAQKKGAKLVVINSSEVKFNKSADLWLDSRKGTSTYIINSLIKYFIDNKLYDENYIEERTQNFSEIIKQYKESTFESTENITGVKLQNIIKFSQLVSEIKKNIIFIYNIDSTADKSVSDLKAIGNFLLLTGRIGREDNGVIIQRQFNNSAGQLEMGADRVYLPGYVSYDDKEEINLISKKWDMDLSEIFKPTDLADKMKKGEIKAVLIFGEDPFYEKENLKYFSNVDFIVSADSFQSSAITEVSDLILPLSTHIEYKGSYTRCDNFIQQGEKVTESYLEAENWQLISRLAAGFSSGFEFENSEDISTEIRNVNRLERDLQDKNKRFEKYFSNGFNEKKLPFIKYISECSTFDTVKSTIHYPENYYLCNVRNKLI